MNKNTLLYRSLFCTSQSQIGSIGKKPVSKQYIEQLLRKYGIRDQVNANLRRNRKKDLEFHNRKMNQQKALRPILRQLRYPPPETGVYILLVEPLSLCGPIYVGYTQNRATDRLADHRNKIRHCQHFCTELQKAVHASPEGLKSLHYVMWENIPANRPKEEFLQAEKEAIEFFGKRCSNQQHNEHYGQNQDKKMNTTTVTAEVNTDLFKLLSTAGVELSEIIPLLLEVYYESPTLRELVQTKKAGV